MPRYLHNALVLLAWAVALPIVIGALGRLLVFRRDEDDVVLHKEALEARLAHGEATVEALQPEPEPVFQEAWPEFESPASAPAPSESQVQTAPAPIVYRGFRHDVEDVRAQTERAWRAFITKPDKPPQWRHYSEWSTSAPYAFAGAAGASPESATLTVSPQSISGADSAQLMQIWNAEILPELEAHYGTHAFRRGATS